MEPRRHFPNATPEAVSARAELKARLRDKAKARSREVARLRSAARRAESRPRTLEARVSSLAQRADEKARSIAEQQARAIQSGSSRRIWRAFAKTLTNEEIEAQNAVRAARGERGITLSARLKDKIGLEIRRDAEAVVKARNTERARRYRARSKARRQAEAA